MTELLLTNNKIFKYFIFVFSSNLNLNFDIKTQIFSKTISEFYDEESIQTKKNLNLEKSYINLFYDFSLNHKISNTNNIKISLFSKKKEDINLNRFSLETNLNFEIDYIKPGYNNFFNIFSIKYFRKGHFSFIVGAQIRYYLLGFLTRLGVLNPNVDLMKKILNIILVLNPLIVVELKTPTTNLWFSDREKENKTLLLCYISFNITNLFL